MRVVSGRKRCLHKRASAVARGVVRLRVVCVIKRRAWVKRRDVESKAWHCSGQWQWSVAWRPMASGSAVVGDTATRRPIVSGSGRPTHTHTLPLRPPHNRYNALVVCFLAIPIVVVMELGRFHQYARERSMGQCVAILSLGAFITCAFVLLSNVLLSIGARYGVHTSMHSSMHGSTARGVQCC